MDPFRVGTSLEACAQIDEPNCITVWAMLRLITVGAHTLTLTHIPTFAYLDTDTNTFFFVGPNTFLIFSF